ncbi:MAG: S24/S26 family peptidase [Bacteroidales bacterium]|nr:S24/S26 family peptidase [Bacteroidales bacterium]
MTEIILSDEVMMESFDALLAEGREVRFTPKGVSMRPFIEGGRDSVILRKNDVVEVGDIVLAKLKDGRFVLHRVIAKSGDNLMLMGDGNLQGTESAKVCDILGIAVGIIKPNGKIVKPKKGRLWHKMLPFRKRLLWIYRKKLKLGI